MTRRSTRAGSTSPSQQCQIVVRPVAEQDLDEIAAYIAQDSPGNAERFIQKILRTIAKLEIFPHRYPLAPESVAFDVPIRQVIVTPYRVLFTIQGQVVRILCVYHGARLPPKSTGQPIR